MISAGRTAMAEVLEPYPTIAAEGKKLEPFAMTVALEAIKGTALTAINFALQDGQITAFSAG